jgi:hypothetical protein
MEAEEDLETPTKKATNEVLDLSGDSSQKKKSKSTAGVLCTGNRYTTKGFTIPLTAHIHTHPMTYVEAAICLTLDDKPKEFIMSIKLLLTNARYLNQHLDLVPLKSLPGNQTKIIVAEDNIPSNFTHLGQYAFTSGNHIFKKKMNWKVKDKQPHQDNDTADLKDPIVYFTVAIATNLPPCTLIDGIRMEWETHGSGKLQIKELQSHKSKVMFVLYLVYRDTSFHIFKKTLEDILCKAAEMLSLQTMLPDAESTPPAHQEIAIHLQVPRLKGGDTLDFNKLLYHVRENRKAIHIEAKPEEKKEFRDLLQFAKEHNLVSLPLGKRIHISKVMDAESTPGKIKQMVKYAMGHANYQGLMTGEKIIGIPLWMEGYHLL